MAEFEEVVRDMFWGHAHTACCCSGPQNGEPVCPCAMKQVRVVDGHYIQIEDLGKVGDPKFNDGLVQYRVDIVGYKKDTKVALMKAIREQNRSLSIKEASDMLKSFPATVKCELYSEEAAKMKAALEENGGIVEIH